VDDPAGLLMQPPFLGLQLDCGPMDAPACTTRVSSVARVAGWPKRDISQIRFVSTQGDYVVRFADGQEIKGLSRPG